MTKDAVILDGTTFLTRDDIMKKFGISTVTLWKWTRDGLLRCHPLGKRVYFIESEICEDLKNFTKGGRKCTSTRKLANV